MSIIPSPITHGPVVQRVDNTIHWMNLYKADTTNYTTQWIVIYPVVNFIHPLSNEGQVANHIAAFASSCLLVDRERQCCHRIALNHDMFSIVPKIPEISDGCQMERPVLIRSNWYIQGHLWRWSRLIGHTGWIEICLSILAKQSILGCSSLFQSDWSETSRTN